MYAFLIHVINDRPSTTAKKEMEEICLQFSFPYMVTMVQHSSILWWGNLLICAVWVTPCPCHPHTKLVSLSARRWTKPCLICLEHLRILRRRTGRIICRLYSMHLTLLSMRQPGMHRFTYYLEAKQHEYYYGALIRRTVMVISQSNQILQYVHTNKFHQLVYLLQTIIFLQGIILLRKFSKTNNITVVLQMWYTLYIIKIIALIMNH